MEKQHKEGTCKVLEKSVVFSAFYVDFLSLPLSSDYHHLNAHILPCAGQSDFILYSTMTLTFFPLSV